jgi:hypothetical protein
MNSIEHVIQFNNEGASFLGAGEDKRAFVSLSQALVMIQRMSEPAVHSLPIDISTSPPASSKSTEQLPGIEKAVAIASQQPLLNLQDSSYFIYNRPVAISPEAPRNHEALSMYSACVILNLALAYHRQGIRGNQFCTQKAERLYEMITVLLRECPMDDDTSVFIRLVAINNVSHIHYEQLQFKQTREELGFLSLLIRQLGAKRALIHQADLDLLLLNVLLITPPDVAPAA